MGPDIERHFEKAKIFIRPVIFINVAALETNEAELRWRKGHIEKPALIPVVMIRRRLSIIITSTSPPTSGKLIFQMAKNSHAILIQTCG